MPGAEEDEPVQSTAGVIDRMDRRGDRKRTHVARGSGKERRVGVRAAPHPHRTLQTRTAILEAAVAPSMTRTAFKHQRTPDVFEKFNKFKWLFPIPDAVKLV